MAKAREKTLDASSVWTSPAAVMLSRQTAPWEDAHHKPISLAHCEVGVQLSLIHWCVLHSDDLSSPLEVLLWKAVMITLIYNDSNFSGI